MSAGAADMLSLGIGHCHVVMEHQMAALGHEMSRRLRGCYPHEMRRVGEVLQRR